MYSAVFTVIVEAKLSMKVEYIPVFVFWKPSDSSFIHAISKVTWWVYLIHSAREKWSILLAVFVKKKNNNNNKLKQPVNSICCNLFGNFHIFWYLCFSYSLAGKFLSVVDKCTLTVQCSGCLLLLTVLSKFC